MLKQDAGRSGEVVLYFFFGGGVLLKTRQAESVRIRCTQLLKQLCVGLKGAREK